LSRRVFHATARSVAEKFHGLFTFTLFEIALVLLRLDDVASRIVNQKDDSVDWLWLQWQPFLCYRTID
jgi:hypothetical protein